MNYASTTTDPTASRTSGTTARRPRVLLVEDDELLAESYAAYLGRAGYDVPIARNLEDCRAQLADSSVVFDAAVIDLNLPDGLGDEIICALLKRAPLCKSVVVTGTADRSRHRALAQSGAHASLTKPVPGQTLLSTVASALEATLKWRELVAEPEAIGADPVLVPGNDDPRGPYSFDLERAVVRLQTIGELSGTQAEVVRRMLLGDSDRQIGARLGTTERTAKYHVGQILQKTRSKSRAGLLRSLLEDAGTLDPEHK